MGEANDLDPLRVAGGRLHCERRKALVAGHPSVPHRPARGWPITQTPCTDAVGAGPMAGVVLKRKASGNRFRSQCRIGFAPSLGSADHVNRNAGARHLLEVEYQPRREAKTVTVLGKWAGAARAAFGQRVQA